MDVRSLLTLAGAVALGALAWRTGGWKGVALLVSALVLWLLLYLTRVLTVMRRAADQPVGHVGSAVTLNSKLKAGLPLLHVVALTHSLGQRLSDSGAELAVYRWSDASDARVIAQFEGGRLRRWHLERPADAPSAP